MFNSSMFTRPELLQKWGPLLDHPSFGKITDSHRRTVTATILENQLKECKEGETAYTMRAGGSLLTEAPVNNAPVSVTATAGAAGDIAGYNPILITLARRALPNLMAYDLCGVQPMSGPSGLVFAMRSRYSSQNGTEALFNEALTDFSGTGSHVANDGNPLSGATSGTGASIFRYGDSLTTGSSLVTGRGHTTAAGESDITAQMAFSIERTTVTAKTRSLKAEYTMELAQDLKAIHGLDAETELANILSTEILAEINREIVRKINIVAKLGSQQTDIAVKGTFNCSADADGRWSAERWKGLLYHLEREANQIAKETRRGRGNIVLCSSNLASALSLSGALSYAPALQTNLNVDDTGNTFVGTLQGKFKVYIDPYFEAVTNDYMTVGYKGSNPIDAGMFYCPYIPLIMVRAVDQDSFQPKIAFKTRYGLINNPFVSTTSADRSDVDASGSVNKNMYYRISKVTNLL